MTTLEKIKAEIIEKIRHYESYTLLDAVIGLKIALKIIDKYAEQEPKITTTSTDEPMVIQYPKTDEPMVMQYPQVDGITPTVVKAEQEPMREFTEEEAKAYSKSLDKMYKPTGFNVFNEPCDDSISRQNIIDTYKSCADMLSDEELEGANLVMEWIYNAPSVRPQEPKVGHWIVHEKPHGIRYLECPFCNVWYLNEHLIRNSFCPNCGAKMVEPTCDTCEYNTASFMPCNACKDKSEYEPQESEG